MFAPDVWLMNWMVDHRAGWATHLATAVMDASGSALVLAFLLVVAAAYVLVRRQWAAGVSVVVAALLAVVVTGLLKAVIGRDRPGGTLTLVHAAGYLMPSTDGALTLAVAAAFFLTTTWQTSRARNVVAALLSVLVVAVGLCLVYLGAHWPTDVLAGWAVGAVIAWGCSVARSRWATGRARLGTSG